MRKTTNFFVSLVVVLSVFTFAPTPSAKASDNLIPNPSVESIVNGAPTDWNQGYLWGDLSATYSLTSNGYNSANAVSVNVTSYASGDAKWYFTPVQIQPNTKYRFSDYYQSTASTQVVAQIRLNNDTISYLPLGQQVPSATWQQSAFTFTSPADAAWLTIFHLISSVGSLTTDEFSLELFEEPPPSDNMIPNPSVEFANNNQPESWSNNRWGENSSTFEYLTSGYLSNRSIRVTTTNYSSGDAKWFFESRPVVEGNHYEFSDYYRSNINTRVVAQITMQDGSNRYISLRTTGPSTSWKFYRDTFQAPMGATRASVFHIVEANGYLITDNFVLMPAQIIGFNRGLLSLTFDDGWSPNDQTALPLMAQRGFRSTQYYATMYIDPNNSAALAAIRSFQENGHEIGSHTITHPDLTTLNNKKLDQELRQSKNFLQKYFGTVSNFASPYGAYNDRVITYIKKYYRSHRTVDAGFNSKDNFDIYRLKVQNILNTTTAAEVASWVATAKNQKVWLILVYHKVDTQNVGPYDTTPAIFTAHLDEISNSGITVLPTGDALNEITAQL